jgi:hypothetical protein
MMLYLILGLVFFAAASSSSSSEDPKPLALDEWQDQEVRQLVSYVLGHERDDAKLSKLRDLLTAAGYTKLAQAVETKRTAQS